MAYTLTGVRTGTSSCEFDNCVRNLKRLFTVTDETTGRTLTVGRRCAAKLTGWKPSQLDIQRRQAELTIRRAAITGEFPNLPAAIREDIVCCDNARGARPQLTAGGTPGAIARPPHRDDERNDTLTTETTEDTANTALSKLTIAHELTLTRHYYCDSGQHSGNYYVRLEGYVPLDVLSTLVEENGSGQSGVALPIDPVGGELADLLDAGLLKAEQLSWDRRNKGLRHTARVRGDGRLELADRTIHATPTRATAALGGSHQNGWKAWRTKDGRTLGELRAELQSRRSAAEDLPAR